MACYDPSTTCRKRRGTPVGMTDHGDQRAAVWGRTPTKIKDIRIDAEVVYVGCERGAAWSAPTRNRSSNNVVREFVNRPAAVA